MLLFVTGASGSGKTAVIPGLKKRLPEFSVHDFDEREVREEGDSRWRQEQTEYWISKAIENQRLGKDTIVCGGAVYGEILACPSINQIDQLAVCLLDCSDMIRVERLRRIRQADPDINVLTWAAWLRVHARDPSWCQQMITRDSYDLMRWDNWLSWQREDPRWQQTIIDTGGKKNIDQITAEVVKWVESEVMSKDQTEVCDPVRDADAMLEEDDT